MIERSLPAGPHHAVRVRFSSRVDGDFHVDGPPDVLAARRRALAPGRWTWLRQVHGSAVVVVPRPGAGAGSEADAAVTDTPGAILAVHTADCAPVVLAADGVVAVAHAGWRGIVAGVLPRAVDAVRSRAEGEIRALVGPCIHPLTYEFGPTELDAVVAVVGPTARSTTADGSPALDLPEAVKRSLARAGVDDIDDVALDTAGPDWFSHRTRADDGRQAAVAWLEATP